ncbi:MAG: hypothetical protein KDD04_10545 [Sinomicrobium sp.]|nr:hypothetical protein [Sinomicrobium sp.]
MAIKYLLRADNDRKPFPPHFDFAAALGEIIAGRLKEERQSRGITNPARNIVPPPSAASKPDDPTP